MLPVLAALAVPAPSWGQAITPGTVLDTVPDRKPALPATPPEVLFPTTRPDDRHDPNAPRFTVNAFAFTGNTVISERVLKRLTEYFIDLQLNLHELNRAADVVTRYYRDNGYPIARAIVPAQKVEKGVVRIEVIEGRIANISVAGNNRYADETIVARTGTLPRDGIVTLDSLERSLLLLNDLPGLSARATLQPGAEFGTTDMVIRAEEKLASGNVNIDNQGRKEVGEWRLDASLDLHNPLTYGDQINLRVLKSQHDLMTYARVGYSLPIRADGMRLGLSYSQVDYRIAGPFAALGIEGEVRNAEAILSYPYIRSRRKNLIFGAGLRRTETAQHTLGVRTSDESISLLSLSALGSWVHQDSSITNATLILAGNGKRNVALVGRQNAQRMRVEIDLNHLQAASKNWDLYLRGNMVF
ncbi:MAG: ShlB/FhaC/HecB family hemolysin secretion/activation protein, partial [Burkholderiales bacterium]|nr:ShlB/FhaC/HecB family hemolysin secretion/activation protein [Burkholderiales bacterium]